MNNVELIGRLTRDPEIRYSQSQAKIARFTLAVDAGKDKPANFIGCLAFDKTADIVEGYTHKGSQIGVSGSIRTGSYDKDGRKVYTTDVVASRVYLLGSRADAPQPAPTYQSYQTAHAAAPAPAPTYQTAQAPAPQRQAAPEQIPVDWMAEPLQPDEDLPF